MRKLTAMVLTVLLLLMMVAPATAITEEESARLNIINYVQGGIDQIQTNGQMSSDEIYSVYVDMALVPQGSVIATVYKMTNQQQAATTYTNITPQVITGVNGANDKLTRFWHYFGNNNRDVIVATKGSLPDETVIGYIYGERKTEIINAYVAGIPECLGNIRLYDNGASDDSPNLSSTPNSTTATKTTPTTETTPEWASKYLSASFALNNTTYVFNDKTETMDVAPYAKDNRTYVPVRYLAYSLGVAPEGISWNQENQTVTVTQDKTIVNMTIGSNIMIVNGTATTMDVAPEAVDNRTMLPARYLAEALGAKVTWNTATNSVDIERSGS